MTQTIHGWDVIPDGGDHRLRLFTIPGTSRKIKLRKDVGPYLVAFAADYHKQIASIDEGTFDDWGWAPVRKGNASSKVSDHCGGVAMDLNATKEGSQGSGSLKFWSNPIKRTKLALLRKRYSLLEWGGDYSSANRDPMHWVPKYGVNQLKIADAIKKLGINKDGVRT